MFKNKLMAILAISCLLAGKTSYSKLEPSDKPVIEQLKQKWEETNLKEKWEETKIFLEEKAKKCVDLAIDAQDTASDTAERVIDFFKKLAGKEEVDFKGKFRPGKKPNDMPCYVSQEELDKEEAKA